MKVTKIPPGIHGINACIEGRNTVTTKAEAAALLRVSKPRVTQLIESGDLEAWELHYSTGYVAKMVTMKSVAYYHRTRRFSYSR